MINRNNSQYSIKLQGSPGFRVYDHKISKTVKVCDSPDEAKALIKRLMRKEKK